MLDIDECRTSQLNSGYKLYNDWLLNYDREKMDSVFS
ncbi:DUF3885 domain-containing protein [uncultured Alteromonas sp.]